MTSMRGYKINVQDQLSWNVWADDEDHAKELAWKAYSEVDQLMTREYFMQIVTIRKTFK